MVLVLSFILGQMVQKIKQNYNFYDCSSVFSILNPIIANISPNAPQLRATISNSCDKLDKKIYLLAVSLIKKQVRDKIRQVNTRIKVHFIINFVYLGSSFILSLNRKNILIIVNHQNNFILFIIKIQW